MSLRYATLFAAIALVAAPFAGAMGNIDVTGDLMLMWFSSDNTVDFDDDGTASGTFHSSGDDGMITKVEDQVTFMRQEGHLYFTVDDLGGDNVMVKIGLEVDRALESGALPGSSYLIPSAAGPTGDNLGSEGLGSPTVDNDPGLDVFVEEAYLKIAQIYDTALTVTLGRQFINIGDDPNSMEQFNTWWGSSFVLGDSSWAGQGDLAQLGTWETDPFDAIRVDWDLDQALITMGFAKVNETFAADEDTSTWFINGAYTGFEGHQLDGYFLLTDHDANETMGDVDFEQYLVGIRLAGDIVPTVAYKVEIAYNNFDFDDDADDDDDAEGFGTELGLNWHPDHEMDPNIGIHWMWLQGDFDDDDSDDVDYFVRPYAGDTLGEIFDSRNVTNEHIIWIDGGFDLSDKWAFSGAIYYFMTDDDEVDTLGVPNMDDDDDSDLGWEVDAYLDYQFNDEIAMQMGGGAFFPGDQYDDDSDDSDDEAYFLRGMITVDF